MLRVLMSAFALALFLHSTALAVPFDISNPTPREVVIFFELDPPAGDPTNPVGLGAHGRDPGALFLPAAFYPTLRGDWTVSGTAGEIRATGAEFETWLAASAGPVFVPQPGSFTDFVIDIDVITLESQVEVRGILAPPAGDPRPRGDWHFHLTTFGGPWTTVRGTNWGFPPGVATIAGNAAGWTINPLSGPNARHFCSDTTLQPANTPPGPPCQNINVPYEYDSLDGLVNMVGPTDLGVFTFHTGHGDQRWEEVPPPIPEPGTALLLGAGVSALAFLRRRR